ncbi:MAG: NAD(P)/FAD-dependent oxidoreductase [Nevskiaceae bacterium]|nr:MAG: NAD(P)/FAD-dependent oxidoreductase [Nevskiaceae bacterium]TBR74750.1 MAG: NAD(P)/FAD-dependent oxidoreductase [Nevskiaceae bacterium]
MEQAVAVERRDVVVVGAGVAGLHELYRLREMGFDVVAFEKGSAVGGTWYWNRYPGARVDSQYYVYQYWFNAGVLKEWNWSEMFPAQPEVERYLNFVADKLKLKKDIRFNTKVVSARFSERRGRWTIKTDQGNVIDAQHFVCCVGMLSAELDVPFPGADKFKGMICHTSRWPKKAVNFKGKTVGVVGVGATGIQVIQTVASECKQLKVFQRTPQYTIAMNNPKQTKKDCDVRRKDYKQIEKRAFSSFAGFDYDFTNGSFWDYTKEERRKILDRLWEDGSLNFWIGSWFEVFTDEKANQEFSDYVREKIRERVQDPETAEKLMPRDYGFGTRRVPLDGGYFEAYNRSNVELVDAKADPIKCITENGIRLASGKEYKLDILVLATGFDGGSGGFTRIDIRGRNGISLKAKWNEDLRTTLGLQVHGFPNLFTVGAPLAPSAAFCNMMTCLVQQGGWIADTIAYLRDHELKTIEPLKKTEDDWVRHHDELSNMTLVPKTKSWYTGANVKGKSGRLVSYIGGDGAYTQRCNEIRESGYKGFALT